MNPVFMTRDPGREGPTVYSHDPAPVGAGFAAVHDTRHRSDHPGGPLVGDKHTTRHAFFRDADTNRNFGRIIHARASGAGMSDRAFNSLVENMGGSTTPVEGYFHFENSQRTNGNWTTHRSGGTVMVLDNDARRALANSVVQSTTQVTGGVIGHAQHLQNLRQANARYDEAETYSAFRDMFA